jgi:hypothetical protein
MKRKNPRITITRIASINGHLVAVDFYHTRKGGWTMRPPRQPTDEEIQRADIRGLIFEDAQWASNRTGQARAMRDRHKIPSFLWQ